MFRENENINKETKNIKRNHTEILELKGITDLKKKNHWGVGSTSGLSRQKKGL